MDVVLVIGDEISTWLSQCVCVCVYVAHKLIIIYVNILTSNKQHNKQKEGESSTEKHEPTWVWVEKNLINLFFILFICFACFYVFMFFA